MTIMNPLNDTKCLGQLHALARQHADTDAVQAFAAWFVSPWHFTAWMRQLDQRDDLGDPWDMPRLPCEVSQRVRFAPIDPNCFERVLMFLAVAEVLDKDTPRTSASLVVDGGWHTFPIELRDGLPCVVVLDPHTTPPRNAMVATAYQARRVSPLSSGTLPTWFMTMARNACIDDDGDPGEARFERAMAAIRRALAHGETPSSSANEDIEYVLALALRDAPLFGARGQQACKRVCRSVRNLSFAFDSDRLTRALRSVADAGGRLAPKALRAALIAEFGPVAAIALHGMDVARGEADAPTGEANGAIALTSMSDGSTGPDDPIDQERRVRMERMRRMTLAFRDVSDTNQPERK